MSRRFSGLSSTMRMRAGATARADPEYSSVFCAISGSAAGRNLTRWDLGRIPGALYGAGTGGGARRRPAGAQRRSGIRGSIGTAVRINLPRILSFVIIAIVIAGVVNVYADAGPIERMARARVCERHPGPCRERLGRVLRTPFFHDLDFVDAGKNVTVRCSRSFIFFGDYACKLREP